MLSQPWFWFSVTKFLKNSLSKIDSCYRIKNPRLFLSQNLANFKNFWKIPCPKLTVSNIFEKFLYPRPFLSQKLFKCWKMTRVIRRISRPKLFMSNNFGKFLCVSQVHTMHMNSVQHFVQNNQKNLLSYYHNIHYSALMIILDHLKQEFSTNKCTSTISKAYLFKQVWNTKNRHLCFLPRSSVKQTQTAVTTQTARRSVRKKIADWKNIKILSKLFWLF